MLDCFVILLSPTIIGGVKQGWNVWERERERERWHHRSTLRQTEIAIRLGIHLHINTQQTNTLTIVNNVVLIITFIDSLICIYQQYQNYIVLRGVKC